MQCSSIGFTVNKILTRSLLSVVTHIISPLLSIKLLRALFFFLIILDETFSFLLSKAMDEKANINCQQTALQELKPIIKLMEFPECCQSRTVALLSICVTYLWWALIKKPLESWCVRLSIRSWRGGAELHGGEREQETARQTERETVFIIIDSEWKYFRKLIVPTHAGGALCWTL